MNQVVLTGRLTRDPEQRQKAVRFTIAVDRFSGGEKSADFIGCVAFDKTGELVMQYVTKGTKILVEGRITTGSYTNKEGQKVYTTDVIANRVEFLESKKAQEQAEATTDPQAAADDFMTLPEDSGDELPFE